MKRGIYETDYGNTAYVSGPKAKLAWDLDAATFIPIEMVDEDSWKRDATDVDEPDEYEPVYWDREDI